MTYNIQIGLNNHILRQNSLPINSFDDKIRQLEKNLIKKLKSEKGGVGLAAPQIGVNLRMIAGMFFDKKITVMCNPEFTVLNEKVEVKEEGCLSMPGVFGKVPRYQSIIVKYQDSQGKILKIKLTDFKARIFQHEIDHLNGILFVDKAVEDLLIDKEANLQLLGLA